MGKTEKRKTGKRKKNGKTEKKKQNKKNNTNIYGTFLSETKTGNRRCIESKNRRGYHHFLGKTPCIEMQRRDCRSGGNSIRK